MKGEPTTNGLTRRSFIKRSVVAAAAVSSMTIFSGLVNAQESGQSGIGQSCYLITEEVTDPTTREVIAYECYFEDGMVLPCYDETICYVRGLFPGTYDEVIVTCDRDNEENRVICDRLSLR